MRVGSLFTGVGGFDLAAEWQGWSIAWQSEIDPYCTELLKERFPGVPNLGDITTINWSGVERPDIITGGFPCQDISYAGKGAGLAGKRSGLWYEYARAIREVGPRYVIVENVRALFTRGFDAVLGTLADLGYDAEWSMYGAADVGAPHRRHRVWILGYPTGQGLPDGRRGSLGRSAPVQESQRSSGGDVADTDCRGRALEQYTGGGATPDGRGEGHPEQGRPTLADTHPERLEGLRPHCDSEGWEGPIVGSIGLRDRASHGQHGWWAVEPDVGRVAHGVPARVDRLRGLGNAIVPECAVPIYNRIKELERGMK